MPIKGYRPIKVAVEEQIQIAQRLISLRQAGRLERVWIDAGVIRVGETSAAGIMVKRALSWSAAAEMVERLEARA